MGINRVTSYLMFVDFASNSFTWNLKNFLIRDFLTIQYKRNIWKNDMEYCIERVQVIV